MTQEQKRILIAEACGWKLIHLPAETDDPLYQDVPATDVWQTPQGVFVRFDPPNHFTSLDTMHEAERTMTNNQRYNYAACLHKIMKTYHPIELIFADAPTRAEAFGLTLGLWKEGE
jgi:hypothetical protein